MLVDDHDLFRTGLRNLLEEQGVDVAGECDNGTDALGATNRLPADYDVPAFHAFASENDAMAWDFFVGGCGCAQGEVETRIFSAALLTMRL